MCLFAVMLFPGTGHAASLDYGGKVGFEHFQWEEFAAEGYRYLKESGTRNVLSGFLGNTLGVNKQFIYRAEAKIYFGTVNYDGRTQATEGQPSVPVQSDTTYNGLNVEGEAGFRTGKADGSFAWDFVGRADVDRWIREIAASTDNTGRPTGKAREEYTIMNLRIGTGPNWRSGRWQGRLIAGFKYPIYTDEYVKKEYTNYDRDINLEPKGQISPFLNFYNNVKLSERFWLTFDAFYDTYRFDQSNYVEVLDYHDGKYKYAYQPKSTQDNYGLQAGVIVSF